MVPAVAVTDAFADHAIAPESQVDWRTHLRKVEQCLKLARPLAAETRDARADRRLRVFAERWDARRLEVEHQNELGREGNVR